MPAFDFDSTAEQVSDALSAEIKGKNVIVTGTSLGGIGAETARVIAKYANLVILTGRSSQKIDETVSAIKQENPAANLRALELDQASFQAVRAAAAKINEYAEPIHVLINNAGVLATPYSLTVDGVETQFATNHLAHFLLTGLIYPKLLEAATPSSPARVVNFSSSAAVSDTPDISFEDYTYSGGETYEIFLGYKMSKLANVLFSCELSRRAAKGGSPRVLAYSLHPGAIDTNIQRWTPPGSMEARRKRTYTDKGIPIPKRKSIHNGAATNVFAAFDPSLHDKSGAFLEDSQYNKDRQPSWIVGSEQSAEKLWELSERLTNISFAV